MIIVSEDFYCISIRIRISIRMHLSTFASKKNILFRDKTEVNGI